MDIYSVAFMFSVSLNDSIIHIYTSTRWLLIGVLPWSTSRNILFPPSGPYLDLFPGIIKKDLSVSLNCLVKFSIILITVMSLVLNLSQLHHYPLHTKSGSRSYVEVSTSVILEFSDSVLSIFIFLSDSLMS